MSIDTFLRGTVALSSPVSLTLSHSFSLCITYFMPEPLTPASTLLRFSPNPDSPFSSPHSYTLTHTSTLISFTILSFFTTLQNFYPKASISPRVNRLRTGNGRIEEKDHHRRGNQPRFDTLITCSGEDKSFGGLGKGEERWSRKDWRWKKKSLEKIG